MVTVVTISFPKGKFGPSGIIGAASRTETAFQQWARDSKIHKLSTEEEKKSGRRLGPYLSGASLVTTTNSGAPRPHGF